MAGEEASRKNLHAAACRVSESGSGASPLLETRMRTPVQCEGPSRCYQEDGKERYSFYVFHEAEEVSFRAF